MGDADDLSYYDRPNQENRGGIFMHAYEAAEVEHVTLEKVTFIDCHRAVSIFQIPDYNYPGYFGKLTTLNIDRCKFLYPYATNAPVPGSIPLPAMDISNWVETARITGNYFDGATSGDVSDLYVKLPVDGFFQTQSSRLICSDNKLRHFRLRGIDQFHDDGLTYVTNANIAIPSEGNTLQLTLATSWQLPAWVNLGQRIFLGPYGDGPAPGFYEIVDIDASGGLDRRLITLENTGHAENAPPNATPANFNLSMLRVPDFSRRASCLIINNEIDCSPVAGFNDGWTNNPGFPYVAIRVTDTRAIVSGNNIMNAIAGIELYDTAAADGRVRGSLVSGNSILLANSDYLDSLPSNPNATPPVHHWLAYYWLYGIVISADGVTVRDNTIQAPTAERVRAVVIGGNNNRVVGNHVIAQKTHDGLNWGFLLGTATTGNYFADNTTENFYYGISDADYGNSGATFTVASHSATGHEYAVVLPGRFIENTSGTLLVGNGSLLKKIISTTAALNFSSVPANSSSEVAVSFNGESLALNDTVMLGLPDLSDLTNSGLGLTFSAHVKDNDEVKVKATNVTGSSINGGTKNYRVTIMQFGQ